MPLPEVIAASLGVAAGGNRAEQKYLEMLKKLGTESFILREASPGDLTLAGGSRIAEGIRRLRAGEVIKSAGFDGEYGKLALFTSEELKNASGQISFLEEIAAGEDCLIPEIAVAAAAESVCKQDNEKNTPVAGRTINVAQETAVQSDSRVTAVIAGPGTGKTFTLTERIAQLVENGVKPEEICAVTFNRAGGRGDAGTAPCAGEAGR